jgi:hypothetical protein
MLRNMFWKGYSCVRQDIVSLACDTKVSVERLASTFRVEIETAVLPKTLFPMCQTTRRHFPEGSNLKSSTMTISDPHAFSLFIWRRRILDYVTSNDGKIGE